MYATKKEARMNEREHYSKVLDHNKSKSLELSNKLLLFKQRAIDAEISTRNTEHQANRSTKPADDVMKYSHSLQGEVDCLNKELKDTDKLIADLMHALDDANMTAHSVGQLFPIKEICKVG